MERYDKPGTLFYFDPPYYKAPFYAHNLALPDYQQMAAILAEIRSRFILSINDHPDIREAFKGFEIKPMSLNYTVSKGNQTTGRGLLITNY